MFPTLYNCNYHLNRGNLYFPLMSPPVATNECMYGRISTRKLADQCTSKDLFINAHTNWLFFAGYGHGYVSFDRILEKNTNVCVTNKNSITAIQCGLGTHPLQRGRNPTLYSNLCNRYFYHEVRWTGHLDKRLIVCYATIEASDSKEAKFINRIPYVTWL